MIKEAIGTGNTVDEAKAAAMVELGISDFDEFTVEVIQTPTKKILGGNPAKVKVSVNVPDPKPEKKEPKKENKKVEKKPEKKAEPKKQEVKQPVKEEVKETVEVPMEATNLYPETAEYIKSIVMSLGMQECNITEKSNAEEIYFELDCGDDYGIIIGKRGETLDAIQYLARMVANKGKSSYKRVSINVGNYRAKREETLRILARKTAVRAVRQRRIIHTAVQEIEGATSHSIGSDLDRRVVISPVEGAKHNGGNRGRNNRHGNGRRERKEAYKPEISPDRAPKSDIDGSALYGKVEIRSTITE